MFREIYEAIRRTHPERPDETLIIGIGGNTGAGKSSFSREFAEFLECKNIKAVPWANDLYQGPRSEKNMKRAELLDQGFDRRDDWWKHVGEIYYDSYDCEILAEHLTRFRNRQDIKPIRLYDSMTGEWDVEMSYKFNGYGGPFWLLHNGVYLFRPVVRAHLDRVVLLTAGEEKMMNDPELGEISEERKIRYERVRVRGKERGYTIDYYAGFLPLDIHTTNHIRGCVKNDENIIIVDNSNLSNRRVMKT